MSTQFQLLKEKRFRPYFFTQFLGGFNDNVFKTALVTLVAFKSASLGGMDSNALVTLLPGIFMLPFFLFSATAGQIADKFERSKLIRILKVIEFFVMLLASLGFYLDSLPLLVATLFLMGTHSTFFGPIKFAYLPQHLKEHELMGGNGMVEMGSFVAILLGQIFGAWLAMHHQYALAVSVSVLPAPKLNINWNPITETYRNLTFSWQHQVIWLAIIAISWFWFFGATVVAQLPNIATHVLHGDESVFILLLVMFSLGVGTGSLLCEKLSKGKVELGLVLFGAIGMSVFAADLYYVTSQLQQSIPQDTHFDYLRFIRTHEHVSTIMHWRLLIDICLLGAFGGFFIVPLYAEIQTRCEKTHLSRVIAGNNIVNAVFMVVSALFSVWILDLGHDIPQLMLITACINIVVMVYLCFRQPEYYRAFIRWISTNK